MKSLALARRAYKLVCFKQDVEDIRAIEADYKAALTEAYIDWVRVLAKTLKKVTDKRKRKAIIKASIKKIQGTLSKLGKEYLTEAFEVGAGLKHSKKKQWEPDIEELEDLLDEAIKKNDKNLIESLMADLEETAGDIFEEPEEFDTQISIREQLMSRAFQVGLYATAAWTLYHQSYTEVRDPDIYYVWRGTDDHVLCDGCRERLEQIYDKEGLPGFPGDGSTECGPNCRCWLDELSSLPFPFEISGEKTEEWDLDEAYDCVPEQDRALLNKITFERNLHNPKDPLVKFNGYYDMPGRIFLDSQHSRLSTFVHEYGHIVGFEGIEHEQRILIRAVFDKYSGLYMGKSSTVRELLAYSSKQATGYAWTDADEFFAECYKLYFTGRRDELTGVPEVLDWFKERYK